MSRTLFASFSTRFVLEFANGALGTFLLFGISLITGFAMTATGRKIPIAIAFAEESWRLDLDSVSDARANRLLDLGDLSSGWCRRKVCKVHRQFWTTYVINFDRQYRYARSLVPEREVNTFFRNWYWFDLRIYDYFGVRVEPSFPGGDTSWKMHKPNFLLRNILLSENMIIIVIKTIIQSTKSKIIVKRFHQFFFNGFSII